MMTYRTILIDPPWPIAMMTFSSRFPKNWRSAKLPYPTLTIPQIATLPVATFAEPGTHLWLWTTNRMLPHAFDLVKAWGFTYHAPITWRKPSGCGAYFVSVTQHLIFAYKDKCQFHRKRYFPTCFNANPQRHSTKPEISYAMIEAISDAPRLELFARRKREGWDVWGNEVECDVTFDFAV